MNFDFKKHAVNFMTKKQYLEPMKNEYAKSLSTLSPEELYDNYNPGPTKPDGSVNFECHCVSHLVGGPCGYEFRRAITCQKSVTPEDMEKGACAEEFMDFMSCATKTKCFQMSDDVDQKPNQKPT
ncbi:CHCH domain-containing protein [Ditylenchus destructor]|uniref:CHCH domain-containing protein n=1 Tax=Ditylenchus destructor TaxID=166010 RepID=A0AAD4MXP0_9BILA|nr:CHCH domain-containing protein [Ditylenchus destructor]